MKFLIILFSFSGLFAFGEIVYEDVLVARVGTEVYFLSDVNQVIEKTAVFQCTLGSSLLLSSYGLSGMQAMKTSTALSKEANKKKMKKILNLLKTMKFVERESLPITEKARGLFLKSARSNGCGKIANEELKYGHLAQILKAELYLKRRFRRENFTVSSAEFQTGRKDFPKLGDKRALEAIRSRRQQNSVTEFVRNLENQIKHRVYI